MITDVKHLSISRATSPKHLHSAEHEKRGLTAIDLLTSAGKGLVEELESLYAKVRQQEHC